MTNSSKKNRRLIDVVPPEADGIQANFCRTPGCKNFGVPPAEALARQSWGQRSAYKLEGAVDMTRLYCQECDRRFYLVSNRALSVERARLRSKNGVLHGESCSKPGCVNAARPVNLYPGEYWNHGKTAAGKPRKRCRRCGTTVTAGLRHKTMARRGINKDIVLDLMNRAALNGIMRKHQISPKTLYERIDFIHEQMSAFEAAKLNALKASKFAGHRFALCTDGQDHMVNWLSRNRRIAVQLTCFSTADNLTGFVFRSDLNFDPLVGDIVEDFERLQKAGEFDDPSRLGLIDRYELRAYFSAVRFSLERRLEADKNDLVAGQLLDELDKISPPEESNDDAETISDNPASGAVIRRLYTALAHFMLLDEIFPADADIHHSTDADGPLTSALLTAMKQRFIDESFDMAVVTFEKKLSNPKKRARVKVYKDRFLKFAAECGATGVTDVRRAFIKAFEEQAAPINMIHGQFWRVPIQTMYEPDKVVGVVHQRRGWDAEDDESRRLSILDRSSLHAADSFFSVLRKRMSYFDRGGHSRSTGTHYHPFQPYRPSMVQKVVDIARVYFNWCEGRPFRLVRKFKTLEQQLADTSHEEMLSEFKAQFRRARREEYSTPAMRLGLAKAPVRLETILYNDWHATAFPKESRDAA